MAWLNVFDIDVSKLLPNVTPASSLPTVLLVHDAFHTTTHLEPFASSIGTAGCRLVTPRLPSSRDSYHPDALEADIQAIFECACLEIAAGREVLLVLNGYSAIPGSVAAERLNLYSLDVPRGGEVVKLVFIAGVILQRDESYEQVLRLEWLVLEDGLGRINRPGQVLYHDCGLERTRSATDLLQPAIMDALRGCAVPPTRSEIPTLYLVCEPDRMVSPHAEHTFVGLLQAYNTQSTVISFQTGHCAFLARPRETSALIIRAASDQT